MICVENHKTTSSFVQPVQEKGHSDLNCFLLLHKKVFLANSRKRHRWPKPSFTHILYSYFNIFLTITKNLTVEKQPTK